MNINNIEHFETWFDIGDGPQNEDFFTERTFLGGWTVSDRHPVKGLKRHTHNMSLLDDNVVDCSIQELKDIIESILPEYAEEKNALFISGGKDSTTLAHILKKLDIPFVPVSLHSSNSRTSEYSVVKDIEKDLGIRVEYVEIDSIPQTEFKYWVENPYTAKCIAIEKLGLQDHVIFTGEVGTGEMQVNQPLLYTAQMGYRPRDLAHWHVNVCGSYRKNNSVRKESQDMIYMECVDYFYQRLMNFKHPDILNKVMFGRLQEEGSYRLLNYSLDKYKWCHPFAESEFIYRCVNMPSHYKGSKNLYREMYPDLTDIPWRYPKSGLGIPTV